MESDIDGGRRVGQRGYEELGSWQRGDGECGLTLHPLPHSPPPCQEGVENETVG